MLESAQVPNQEALVAFVRKGITSLGAASIERVEVYGRKIGEEFPDWSREFELVVQLKSSSLHLQENATIKISISNLDTEQSKISQPSIQSKNSNSPNTLKVEIWAIYSIRVLFYFSFIFLLLSSLQLLFINWQFALITFVIATIIPGIYQQTPAGKYDTEKLKLESQKRPKKKD